MRTVQLLISSFALMAAFLMGCETTHTGHHVDKPTARMVSLRLQDVKLCYATLLFDVEIDNPYPASLPLVGLSYSLTSGGGTFITATPIHQAAVPPNGRQIVALPDEVIYERLLTVMNSKPGLTIPFRAGLWLQVDISNLGLVEMPLKHEGRLVLPKPPETNSEGKTHQAVDKAHVITLYLDLTPNVSLVPQLEKLRPGFGIPSHDFRLEGVEPEKSVALTSREYDNRRATCLLAPSLSKVNKEVYCSGNSFTPWLLDSTSPRFAARRLLKSGLGQLSWTVWPLCADMVY